MKIVHKSTAKKYVRENNYGVFYIAPSDVNAYHINTGWCMGYKFEMVLGRDGKLYVIRDVEDDEEKKFTTLEFFLLRFHGRTRFWAE